MPILECPKGASDGGYAVSDFRNIDQRVGTMDELRELSSAMRRRNILLTLDVVVNHTSDENTDGHNRRDGRRKSTRTTTSLTTAMSRTCSRNHAGIPGRPR